MLPQSSVSGQPITRAKELAGDKQFAVILAVEREADGTTALASAASSLAVATRTWMPNSAPSWPAI